MEENVQINRFLRWVGIGLCVVIISITIISLFLADKPPVFFFFSNVAILALFLPVCVLGYIPGEVLDKLPKFLVNAIKLDFKGH